MPVDITIPSVGESITEGTVSRWFKKDGDWVQVDEPLLEVETMKATTQIAAPVSGTLHITVAEGETVPVGSVVGRIEESVAAPSHPQRRDGLPKAEEKKAKTEAGAPPEEKPEKQPAREPTRPSVEPRLLPAARRLAAETGVDVSQVTGTGRGGRITKEDVQTASVGREPSEVAEQMPAGEATVPPATVAEGLRPPLTQPQREERKRMSSIRQRIAARLVESQKTTASLTTFNEADLSAVMALRRQYQERFQEKHGVGLGIMSFFVKAAVEALRRYPVVNARIDGNDIVYQHFYDIGIAVSTERGLMVPILRDADQMSFAAIEKKIAELAQKARDGQITVQDLQGGTFTITNGGVFGSLLSTPILNPPQSAILGMHAIQKRPAVVNDQIVIRPMMYLALTYDHRLIDGREAVLFLVRVKECIENPERLLLEV